MEEINESSQLTSDKILYSNSFLGSHQLRYRRRAEISTHCECHVPDSKGKNFKNNEAQIKLVIAAILALTFAIAEAIGGYFSSSLAILTDAAHMLSDFSGILVSLLALWLSRKRATKSMSFGFHRAEIMGAVISVLIIWLVTGILVYEGIQRVIHQNYEIDADIMLITAVSGLYVNVFMTLILQTHVHHMEGLHHSHGHDDPEEHEHDHGHDHEHEEHDHSQDQDSELCIQHDHKPKGRKVQVIKAVKWVKSHLKHSHSHSHDNNENINLRAAMIHCIGDIVQSIGVIIAAYIIRFKPDWKIVDPICTFIFSILVLITTLNIMKDAIHVLMEGTPKNINYFAVKKDLTSIEGVEQAHTLNIWSISSTRTALAGHLVIRPEFDSQDILKRAVQLAKAKYNIDQCTLQVETHDEAMDECHGCQSEAQNLNNKEKGFFSRFIC